MTTERFYDGVIGMEVTDHNPERYQAEVAARVEAARRLGWPQAELSDFEVIGSSWKPVFVSKADGTQYGVVSHDPLLQANPPAQEVACFLLDGAGQLVFLKHRGAAAAPVSQTIPGRLYSGRLERRDGRYEVVDVRSGAATELGHGAFAG